MNLAGQEKRDPLIQRGTAGAGAAGAGAEGAAPGRDGVADPAADGLSTRENSLVLLK